MIKAILMDWNGVVIDDEQVQCEAYREVMKPHGIELTDEGYYARMGMNDVAFIRSVFAEAGKELADDELESVKAAKTAKWRESVSKNLPLFDGIENFVRKTSTELDLGVVSMANREEIDLVLDLSGLRPYFSVVLTAEDIHTHKPDPACYREGFRQIDLARIAKGGLPMVHADCLVIEDSPQGVQAGKAADLPVLGVANTVSADELRAAGADAVGERLDDWMPETFRRVFAR
ncbi:MAG TPA: HAD family phosphatase [Pyrinomonadaceae bacterium]|nr:HAD family phosphatase [Pyrinomonadaceae bacterium]HMP65968.1 HAD family phosphatase [Pyrinomonadaceae bacterium]